MNSIHNVHVLGPAKDGMDSVKMRGVNMSNKELAPTSVFSSMRHGQRSRSMFLIVNLTVDLVTGSTGSCSGRAPALNHKTGDNPVKDQAVIIALLNQICEILHRARCIRVE